MVIDFLSSETGSMVMEPLMIIFDFYISGHQKTCDNYEYPPLRAGVDLDQVKTVNAQDKNFKYLSNSGNIY